MKRLLINLLLISYLTSVGQDRVNKELPKISKNLFGKLTTATGWHLDEKGQWVSRQNRITDYLDVLDDEKLAIGMNAGIDNFTSYQIRPVKMNGKNYFIFIKRHKTADGNSHSKWTISKRAEFLVFDSIQFSRTITEKMDTISVVEVNTIHAGEIPYTPTDTTFITEIESELAKRSPNDGFHGWDILFKCRLYKAKGLIQFLYNSPMPQLKTVNFNSNYYETDIANFKNLFGPDLHLNFDDLFLFKVKVKPAEIFTITEEMPDFPGGSLELRKFTQQNLKTPSSFKSAYGSCYLKFVVTETGQINDITITKGVSDCIDCDNEAIRLVKSMPTWKPGKQNGRPVSVYYNLILRFGK